MKAKLVLLLIFLVISPSLEQDKTTTEDGTIEFTTTTDSATTKDSTTTDEDTTEETTTDGDTTDKTTTESGTTDKARILEHNAFGGLRLI